MMPCPTCHGETAVIDSRIAGGTDGVVRRRRRCVVSSRCPRFTTYEVRANLWKTMGRSVRQCVAVAHEAVGVKGARS